MITIIIILSIFLLVSLFIIRNLLIKQEKAEDLLSGYLLYLDRLSRVIEISDKKINELDSIGAFANDDETGTIFDGIKQIQEILNEFNVKQQ